LRRMGWQKEQMQPLGNSEGSTLVPTRLIHHQQQAFLRSHTLLLSKGAERQRKGFSIDCGHEQPRSLSALRLNKAIEIHPLIARPDYCPQPCAFLRPHPAQDRFEPDTVLILAPEFYHRFGILLSELVEFLGKFF